MAGRMDGYLSYLGEEYWTPFGTAVLRITSFYFGSFFCLPAAVQSQNNFPERFPTFFFRARIINRFFAIFCGSDFIRGFNRIQPSMAYPEPGSHALLAELSRRDFNRYWFLEATETVG